jgi:cytochrome d ubiquinol oxidase subunit I
MDTQEPMKMAAAEANYHTANGANFSLLSVGNLSDQPVFQIGVPHVLSLIEDLSWNGQVPGIDNIQGADAAKYGPGSYVPMIWLSYWSFRTMVGIGFLLIGLGGWGVWLARRRKLTENTWFRRAALVGIALPFVANTSGWVLTEAGRQPWIVYGVMLTAKGVSTVTVADVAATLGAFVLVYTVLGVIDVGLMLRSARRPLDTPDDPAARPLVPSLVY